MNKTIARLLIVVNLSVSLQTYSQRSPQPISRNTLFLESSSAGPGYSINFDRLFTSRQNINFSYRIGFHYLNQNMGLPLGVNMITGSNHHHAEFSITLIPFVKRFNYLFKEGSLSDKQLYIIPGIGYRFQKPGGGIFLRSLVSPMIFLDPPSDNFWKMDSRIQPLISIGAGWTFR